MDVSGTLGVLVTLFAIVAVLGVAFVYFRGSADKATIESQGRLIASIKDENVDLRRRVEVLEQENQQLHKAVAQVSGIEHVQETVNSIKQDTGAILVKVTS